VDEYGEVKGFFAYVRNACRGIRDRAAFILNLGPRWRLVVSFTPRPLYLQGKNHDTY
jgi:hypothetical protein